MEQQYWYILLLGKYLLYMDCCVLAKCGERHYSELYEQYGSISLLS